MVSLFYLNFYSTFFKLTFQRKHTMTMYLIALSIGLIITAETPFMQPG